MSYLLAIGFGLAIGSTRAYFQAWHRAAHRVMHPLIFGCDGRE